MDEADDAFTDPGTGYHSRDGFLHLGEHELRVAARRGSPVTILVVGVSTVEGTAEDERWGLVALVDSLGSVLRGADVVGRWDDRVLAVLPVGEAVTPEPILHRLVDRLGGWASQLPPSVRIRAASTRWDPIDPTPLTDLLERLVAELGDAALLYPRY